MKPQRRVPHRGQLFCKIFYLNDVVFRQLNLPHLSSPSTKFKSHPVTWQEKRLLKQTQARLKRCAN